MNAPDLLLDFAETATARDQVLIVDDETEILVALADLLEDEFDVLTATSGDEGLQLVATHPDIAVIISDQRMRDMTGDVFLAEARTRSDAGTVLLTGYADIETVIGALNRGAISFYAAKPWEPDGLRAMVREAASACRTRRALALERSLLRSLFDNLPLGLAFKNGEGRITRLNALAAESLGRPEKECLGRTEEELLLPGEKLALEAPSGASEIVRRRDASGQERWHRIARIPLDDAGHSKGSTGKSGISVLIDQDVTDLIDMEKRLRQTDKMQAIGTLAGGIAHDFNNLLTAVLGSLELVTDLSPPTDPNIARLFTNAMDAARRGAVLTQKLLDFSRPRDLARRPVSVSQLLGQMQGLLAQSIGRGGARAIPVRLELPADPLPPASTDPSLLEVALVNLCLNARDAQPNGGEIVISAREDVVEPDGAGGASVAGDGLTAGRYVVITVTDRGVGMSPETQARIFEPFFTTKAVGSGIGLGLPMIYGFMQRNEGDVRVSSSPGSGTSIELWLPAADGAPANAEKGEQTVSPPRRYGGMRSILVVDDEPAVAAVTVGFLAKAGFQVMECHNGESAIDLVRQRSDIGLVIMDLLMPEMNGDECARRISVIRPDLKVLFVTGYADRTTLPSDAHVLAKPFTRERLLAGVENLLAA